MVQQERTHTYLQFKQQKVLLSIFRMEFWSVPRWPAEVSTSQTSTTLFFSMYLPHSLTMETEWVGLLVSIGQECLSSCSTTQNQTMLSRFGFTVLHWEYSRSRLFLRDILNSWLVSTSERTVCTIFKVWFVRYWKKTRISSRWPGRHMYLCSERTFKWI